jgi:hypothetical protein
MPMAFRAVSLLLVKSLGLLLQLNRAVTETWSFWHFPGVDIFRLLALFSLVYWGYAFSKFELRISRSSVQIMKYG